MKPGVHRSRRAWLQSLGLGAAASLAGAGCAGGWQAPASATRELDLATQGEAPAAQALARWMGERPLCLLGEVHDHAQQHALRLAAFQALLRSGARPALLLEMIDRGRQPQLLALRGLVADALPAPMASQPAQALAERIVQSALGRGWHAPFYRPFIAEALTAGLPIDAVNVGREEARRVMREGLAAHGWQPQVPQAALAGLAGLIEASHCGMVDTAMARRMALAQVARDQSMAQALVAHGARGAVLLAGNGHVRRDWGAPLWLPPAWQARAFSIGLLEPGDASGAAFDRVLRTPAQERADPCAGLARPPA
jgi:uncharacterized iron-regulated protein